MALKSVRLFSLFILLGITLYSKAQNLRIDGYKGIWYTIGQKSEYGDKYSGGLATYTANHTPVAIYASKVDKTFFVYGGTTSEKDKHLLIMYLVMIIKVEHWPAQLLCVIRWEWMILMIMLLLL